MANKTIDLRAKFTDHVGTETLICQYEDANNYWVLEHVHGTGLQFRVVSGGTTIVTLAGGEVSDTNWHHVALCKVSDEYGIYLDGSQTAYVSDADTDAFAGVLYVGSLAGSNYFDGYIDQARITDANDFSAAPVVGLTDIITVPTEPYTAYETEVVPFSSALSTAFSVEIGYECVITFSGGLSTSFLITQTAGDFDNVSALSVSFTADKPYEKELTHSSALSVSFLPIQIREENVNSSLSADFTITEYTIPQNVNSSLSVEFSALNLTDFIERYSSQVVRRYYFILTGRADGTTDIEIPITSFQARRRGSDSTSFLSVVVKGNDYDDEITARPNGQMVIEMSYQLNGVNVVRKEIARVDFETITIYEGGTNTSTVLEGRTNLGTVVGQSAILENVQYTAIQSDGKQTIRGAVDIYLNPGDIVTYDVLSFEVESITYSVSVGYESMTVVSV